jgi:hypothetical protein
MDSVPKGPGPSKVPSTVPVVEQSAGGGKVSSSRVETADQARKVTAPSENATIVSASVEASGAAEKVTADLSPEGLDQA